MEASTPTRPRWRNAAIFVASAWSGFFVMGIELLGGRLLAPFFGSSVFVWGALIAVFMASLSIDYLLGGHLLLRSSTLDRLGLLLATAALLALPIVLVGNQALDWLSYAIVDPRYGALAGALLLFGASTLVSGTVSPYAVRLLVDDVAGTGHSAGLLYFASTLGSAAGTIMTSFYLVLWFRLDTIILGFIAISLLVGSGLWIAPRMRA